MLFVCGTMMWQIGHYFAEIFVSTILTNRQVRLSVVITISECITYKHISYILHMSVCLLNLRNLRDFTLSLFKLAKKHQEGYIVAISILRSRFYHFFRWKTWSCFNIKIPLCQYMNSHYRYKTVPWQSHRYNGNTHTQNTVFIFKVVLIANYFLLWIIMMTSSNRNIIRVTGPLCGEFTGPGEFPTQRPVTRSFDVFFHLRLNKRLSKQPRGWWFETL